MDIPDDEYNEFYKSLTKDTKKPLTKVHFIAEGEVTFKSLLFVPETQPGESFNRYGSKSDNIKVSVLMYWSFLYSKYETLYNSFN